jgi:hypothetical protein
MPEWAKSQVGSRKNDNKRRQNKNEQPALFSQQLMQSADFNPPKRSTTLG